MNSRSIRDKRWETTLYEHDWSAWHKNKNRSTTEFVRKLSPTTHPVESHAAPASPLVEVALKLTEKFLNILSLNMKGDRMGESANALYFHFLSFYLMSDVFCQSGAVSFGA